MRRIIFTGFICALACFSLLVTSAQANSILSSTPTSKPSGLDQALTSEVNDLEKAKSEVQALKDAWDRSRLEATLYEKRAKRAYLRWVKAAKNVKAEAQERKEKAELELQLAVEKRKLAYSFWQTSVFKQAAKESEVKALAQQKDTVGIKEKIKQLETKLGPPKENN